MTARPTASKRPFPDPLHRTMAEVLRDEQRWADWFDREQRRYANERKALA